MYSLLCASVPKCTVIKSSAPRAARAKHYLYYRPLHVFCILYSLAILDSVILYHTCVPCWVTFPPARGSSRRRRGSACVTHTRGRARARARSSRADEPSPVPRLYDTHQSRPATLGLHPLYRGEGSRPALRICVSVRLCISVCPHVCLRL